MMGSMKPSLSLDERYLAFNARTGGVFAAHPQLEPLRQLVFKQLLIQGRGDGWWQLAKHWMRPLRRRAHTHLPPQADVLVWIESRREVIVDALMPVYRELIRRGVRTALLSDGAPPDPAADAAPFTYPARSRTPAWATEAWEELCTSEPTLQLRRLRQAFWHAAAMLQGLLDEQERLLEAVAPRTVVVATTQLRRGAGLTVAARRYGAQSLLLQHGILHPFYTPVLADRMVTWGPASDHILVALGVSPARLVAAGSPRHDTLGPSQGGRGPARERLQRALGLPDRPTFVFFSNGNDPVRNGAAPAACAVWLDALAARYSAALNVVVRLHPNEDGTLYRQCRHLTMTRDTPTLGDTLDGCDGLGSLCSTVLYDGLLYGKPIWQFHADDWPALADNWRQGLARRVSSESELGELAGTLLDGGSAHEVDDAVVARVFANHGRATQRVADVVMTAMSRDGADAAVPSARSVMASA